MGRLRLLLADFVLSFMWVCSGVLVRLIVFQHLGCGHSPLGEAIKTSFSVANMFLFAFLVKLTRGAAYNPLTVLADAISGNFNNFLFCVGARIPAQVLLFFRYEQMNVLFVLGLFLSFFFSFFS